MKRFDGPYEQGESNGNGFGAVARAENGKFVMVIWNEHHKNWLRENRDGGIAYHKNLDVVVNDNLGGGPVYMTLSAARDAAGITHS